MNRAGRAGRRQLHGSEVLPDHEIGIDTPPQSGVEGLGAVNVGYGNRDDLEFQIDGRGDRDTVPRGCSVLACVLLMTFSFGCDFHRELVQAFP
jgi:hypothetical protein